MSDGIAVDASKLDAILVDFLGLIDDPAPLLRVAAEEGAVHAIKKKFDVSGPGWKELAPLTLLNRRGGEGKPLQDTGALMNSILAGDPSGDSVDVGTNLIYAALQNFGGTVTPKSPPALRVPAGPGAFLSLQSVTIPARPFLDLTDEDVEDIAGTIEDFLRLRWQ